MTQVELAGFEMIGSVKGLTPHTLYKQRPNESYKTKANFR